MSDTRQGECRICGDDTDLIEGICQECIGKQLYGVSVHDVKITANVKNFIRNAIKNQLYQHGHKEYRDGDGSKLSGYNPKIDLETEVEITANCILEYLYS